MVADALEQFYRLRGHEVERLFVNRGGEDVSDADADAVQDAFARLVASGAVYIVRDDGDPEGRTRWKFRRSAWDTENQAGLARLSGWTEAAIQSQIDALAPVRGIEFEAFGLDGRKLTVFTHLPEAIKEAAFVLISPRHEDVGAWTLSATDCEADTGILMQVPGLDQPIPLVVSSKLEERFGVTAALGIPSREQADHELAERLPARSQGLRIKTRISNPEMRPAFRFAAGSDPMVSGEGLGVPVPPTDVDAAPRGMIAPWFVSAVMAALKRESPAAESCRQILVQGPDDGLWVMNARAAAKAIRDAAGGDGNAGEPFDGVVLCEEVTVHSEGKVLGWETVAEEFGPEAIRMGMLAPSRADTRLALDTRALRRARAQSDRLRAFAMERLDGQGSGGEVRQSDRPRARLSLWCDTAIKQITSRIESLELHRAVQGLERLAQRIEDFEQQSDHELDPVTRQEAVETAVRLWVRLAKPLLAETVEKMHCLLPTDERTAAWPEPAGPPAKLSPPRLDQRLPGKPRASRIAMALSSSSASTKM